MSDEEMPNTQSIAPEGRCPGAHPRPPPWQRVIEMSQELRAQALGLYKRLLKVQRKAFGRDWQLVSGTRIV